MSLTISDAPSAARALTASTSGQPATNSSNGPTSKAGANTASAAAQQQQQAALNRLLAKYKADIGRVESPTDLASLSRQIAAAAKALGQHVTLPKTSATDAANANSGQPSDKSPSSQSPASAEGKVNLTA